MTPLTAIWLTAGGIAAAGLVAPVPAAAAATAAAGLALVLGTRRAPVLASAGIVAFAFAAGGLAVHLDRAEGDVLRELARGVPHCAFEARVVERAGGLGTLVALHRLDCDHARVRDAGVAMVSEDPGPPGAIITGTGWIVPLRDEPFDRARSAAGAAAGLHPRSVRIATRPRGVFGVAARTRARLGVAGEPLEPARAALLRGLAVGDTDGLGAPHEEALRATGLAHLVAVSGSNVAMVVAAAALVAWPLGRRGRLAVCLVAVGAYLLLVGPDASVLRAVAMAAIAIAALVTGTRADPLHALGLALCALLLLRPGLVHSVGLHLSAAATAGIVLWGRRLTAAFSRLPYPVAAVLGATLAAQVAVAPVTVAAFGRISLIAPVTNLAAAPAVPPATALTLGAALAGPFPPVSRLLMRAAEPFAAWILVVAERGAAVPLADVEVPSAAALLCVAPLLVGAAATLRRPLGTLVR